MTHRHHRQPGKLLPSAHQIEREFAIMSRLTELGPTLPAARRVPLPKPIVFCHDVRFDDVSECVCMCVCI